MVELEFKIQETINDTMEQYVKAVKMIKEEMVVVGQLQEKKGNILVALEPSVQELKEQVEDKIGGEDQPMLNLKMINLDPFLGGIIPESAATPTLPPLSPIKWNTGFVALETSVGTWGSSWNKAQTESISEPTNQKHWEQSMRIQ